MQIPSTPTVLWRNATVSESKPSGSCSPFWRSCIRKSLRLRRIIFDWQWVLMMLLMIIVSLLLLLANANSNGYVIFLLLLSSLLLFILLLLPLSLSSFFSAMKLFNEVQIDERCIESGGSNHMVGAFRPLTRRRLGSLWGLQMGSMIIDGYPGHPICGLPPMPFLPLPKGSPFL